MSHHSAEDLLAAFYGCDNRAFDSFHSKLADYLLNLVKTKGLNQADAEDVVQEVFINVIKTKDRPSSRFDPNKGSLKGWLSAIICNCILSQQRRSRLESPFSELQQDEEDASEPFDPVLLGMGSEDDKLAVVREAVLSLSEPMRTIIQWTFWEDLTLSECAERLGLSVVKVHRVQKKALESLRSWLKGENRDLTLRISN